MKKFFTILLSILTAFGFMLGGCTNQPANQPEKLDITYQNGIITLSASEETLQKIDEYKIFVNNHLLSLTDKNTFDVARAIIKNKPIAFGTWTVTAEGYSASEKVIDSQSFSFDIKELNQQNFVNILKNDYDKNDYFLLSEDIYLYGRGNANINAKNDYKIEVLTERADNGNAVFFVKEPFTATLDGGGYALNFVVDEHINWSGSQLPFVYGGVFNEVANGAVIKNLQAYLDSVYEVKSRSTASASFIFKLFGTLENVFVDQTNRPMIRPKLINPDGSTSEHYGHDTDNYLNKDDNRVAVVSHAESGARIFNCIFYTKIYNVDGELCSYGGGAVGYSLDSVEYLNCAYVSEVGSARFFNAENSAAVNKFVQPVSDNILFFSSAFNLLSGLGKKVAGELSKTPLFIDFSGNPVADFGSAWTFADGDFYLLNKLIVIF